MQQIARGIVFIDMLIRDTRVLNWLRELTADGAQPVSYEQVAQEFECHRRTARAIMHRLEAAGEIQVNKDAKRGGYLYYAPKPRDTRAG
jgi:predicted ArsR family transcriptional regulator